MYDSKYFLGHEPILRSRTVYWCGTDQKELFYKHMKDLDTRQQLEELGYDENSIEYSYNEYGFRCGTFPDHNNTIMFLGCSYTEGVGLRYEDVYANKVAKELGLDCVNLGVGGSGNDGSLRRASYWIPKLQPKIVVHQGTFKDRIEFPFKEEYVTRAGYQQQDWAKDFYNLSRKDKLFFRESYRNAVMHPIHLDFLYDKNMYAIKGICNTFGSQYFHFDFSVFNFHSNKYARDLSHPGVQAHQELTDYVIQLINGYK
tara:strand:- start:277 stop:1047 length:771 start_codon:yes stop_codon:yes gene_type:complete